MKKRKKQHRQPAAATITAVVILAVIWLMGGNPTQIQSVAEHPLAKIQQLVQEKQQQSSTTKANVQQNDLAKLNYVAGKAAVVNVNGGKCQLKMADWQENRVRYQNLDSLNRTSQANVACLEPRNLANDSLRVRQYIQPTGWHQKFVAGEPIINRGHLIAYSLSKGIAQDGNYQPNLPSGDQNNPKNLFTQTAFSNQKLQTIYEAKVRAALRANQKVIYSVQPIFRSNELMARGVQLQALSADGSLNFNVYIYNVQPGVEFDYATGRSTIDHQMTVPEVTE